MSGLWWLLPLPPPLLLLPSCCARSRARCCARSWFWRRIAALLLRMALSRVASACARSLFCESSPGCEPFDAIGEVATRTTDTRQPTRANCDQLARTREVLYILKAFSFAEVSAQEEIFGLGRSIVHLLLG